MKKRSFQLKFTGLFMLQIRNNSFKSCDTVGDLFRNMFPDSTVASRFSCGEKKCAYLSKFGISPYFQSLLLSKVKSANESVLLFDESLNSNLQSKQLDKHIRFWKGSQVSSGNIYNGVICD